MKDSRILVVLLAVLVGLSSAGSNAVACGDKLVIVGRGLNGRRATAARHRASILVYADPGGSIPAALDQGRLRENLERAGHRLRTATSREEFETALGTGSYDLVIADVKGLALLEGEIKAAASRPTILPTLFNPSASELAEASRYTCVVKAPGGDQKDYMTVINEAMAERAKQAPRKTR